VLFRPVEALRVQFPSAPVAHNLDDALRYLELVAREVERNGG